MNIAQKIYKIRNDNKLSQDNFANIIGVSRQTVINWEKEKSIPESSLLNTISIKFNIDINSLIDDNKEICYLENNNDNNIETKDVNISIADDNELLYKATRTIICSKFILFIYFALLSLSLLILIIVLKNKYMSNYIFFSVLTLIFIIMACLVAKNQKSYEILLYKNKYILKSGLIKKTYYESQINKYDRCIINQSFFGGIFNYGNIVIYHDDSKINLGSLKYPYKLKEFMQNYYK